MSIPRSEIVHKRFFICHIVDKFPRKRPLVVEIYIHKKSILKKVDHKTDYFESKLSYSVYISQSKLTAYL